MAAFAYDVVMGRGLASSGTDAPDTVCDRCRPGPDEAGFSMAYQPIVDMDTLKTVAYEALVRGLHGESAATVLGRGSADDRYRLDQQCRVKAIEVATTLGLLDTKADLCINFYPNAVVQAAACLKNTIRAAELAGLPLGRVIFEITEMERLRDPEHLKEIVKEYHGRGLRLAIDDFGAGFSGLSMLAAFQPDIVKIDIELTKKVHERKASEAIVRSIAQVCRELNLQVIAEGVEEEGELDTLREMGIRYFQGFYFARPEFERLPLWPL